MYSKRFDIYIYIYIYIYNSKNVQKAVFIIIFYYCKLLLITKKKVEGFESLVSNIFFWLSQNSCSRSTQTILESSELKLCSPNNSSVLTLKDQRLFPDHM